MNSPLKNYRSRSKVYLSKDTHYVKASSNTYNLFDDNHTTDDEQVLIAQESIKKRRADMTLTLTHTEQINADLLTYGADIYDMLLPETHELANIIHEDERITGIVFGKYSQSSRKLTGRGALVSTNKRVLLIDKKPLYKRCDEIGYHVISAVSYVEVGFAGTVILYTRMGDISIRTLNKKCAKHFIESIEAMILKEKWSHV